MHFRWFKMGLEGRIAIVNLVLFGVVLLIFLAAFPDGIRTSTAPKSMLLLHLVLEALLAILAFPVGWLALAFRGVSDPPITAAIFVPLNAYVWGYTWAAIVRWRRACKKRDKGPEDGRSHPD